MSEDFISQSPDLQSSYPFIKMYGILYVGLVKVEYDIL